MKPDCHPNELALYWTLSQDERALLANKTGAGVAPVSRCCSRAARWASLKAAWYL